MGNSGNALVPTTSAKKTTVSDSAAGRDSVVAVLLAAGLSTRMGKPKMLLPWLSTTLLNTMIERIVRESLLSLLVVHNPGLIIEDDRDGVSFLCNKNPDRGLSHSIRLAIERVCVQWPEASVAILLGDQPFVTSDDIRSTLTAFKNRSKDCHALRPRYSGLPGHPVILDREALSWAEQLEGDRGFGYLWRQCGEQVGYIDYSVRGRPNPAIDIDTPEDYGRALRLVSSQSKT